MKNPYEVLGVSDNASDEEIREAYRVLARKYNGDNYSGGPLSDISQRKMREIDEAYDYIILNRGKNSGGGGSRSGGSYAGGTHAESASYEYSSSFSDYSDIREKVKSGRYDDANTLLDGIPKQSRNAEWYYLKGSVQYRLGWLEEAYKNFSEACRMDPTNNEYKAAMNNFNQSRSGGYRTTQRQTNRGCSGCDVCSSLICADCCCECFGGDLIPCC